MLRRAAVAVAAIGLATTACGGVSVDQGEASGTSAYGDPADAPATVPASGAPTTAPAATGEPAPTAVPTTAAATAAAAATKGVANRTERLDPSGFFLVLVAAGATTFETTDRVTFELTFENRSQRTLVHDSNQQLRFVLYRKLGGTKTEQAWTNDGCRRSRFDQPLTGVLEIEPGERGSFIDYYPTKDESAAADGCRVTRGEYLLVGVLDWCPPDTLRRSEYNGAPYCDKDKVQRLQSAPLALTFV